MTCFIVFTSIFKPTEAVRLWSKVPGWGLIGVGDNKTPADWSLPGCHFIPRAEQVSSFARCLPDNHYSRKMLGYVHAIRSGAEEIFDTDDDNRPKRGWSVPPFDGHYETATGARFVNAYNYFTEWDASPLWPRGFPLRLAAHRGKSNTVGATTRVAVWQGLVDGDPDVDAIYRMTRPGQVEFRDREPLVLDIGSVCPFNSQNTAFRREAFPLLYLPITVTFRFTDILRGLVAQPILWKAGYRVGFTKATAVQDRNEHDLMKDFESEIPVYLNAERIHRIVDEATSGGGTIALNLSRAYSALLREGIVEARDLSALSEWLVAIGC